MVSFKKKRSTTLRAKIGQDRARPGTTWTGAAHCLLLYMGLDLMSDFLHIFREWKEWKGPHGNPSHSK